MAGTNGHAELVTKNSGRPPTSAKILETRSHRFSEPLIWDDPAKALGEFHALVEDPPLHSVVISIAPTVAEQILRVANNSNRPMTEIHAKRLAFELDQGGFEMTGDTVKFASNGEMLDGQHRLQACVQISKPLTTHVIFGLDKKIFDVLDQGRKRTAGDVLAKDGVPDHTIVAAAIGWVLRINGALEGKRGNGFFSGGTVNQITPRRIRHLARRELKDITKYTADARLINLAYKHPPSMITAVLYLIGQHSETLAHEFAQEWAHGAKRGRNQNFDVLSTRLMKIARQSGGHVAQLVRTALVINTFNHWNARVVASERSMVWQKEWRFPRIETNAEDFLSGKQRRDREDTSLYATQMRVLKALSDGAEGTVASLSHSHIAKAANVSMGSIGYIISTLVDDELIDLEAERQGTKPASYRLNTDKWKENARV